MELSRNGNDIDVPDEVWLIWTDLIGRLSLAGYTLHPPVTVADDRLSCIVSNAPKRGKPTKIHLAMEGVVLVIVNDDFETLADFDLTDPTAVDEVIDALKDWIYY